MKRRFIKTGIFVITIILVSSIAYSDSISLTTFYPAPHGSYDRLRLVPRSAMSNPCDVGTMFVLSSGQLQYCQDNGSGTGYWGLLGSAWILSGDNLYPAETDSNPDLLVGIGTTTPSAQLHITGTGQILLEGATPSIEFKDLSNADFKIIKSYNPSFSQLNIQSTDGSWFDMLTLTAAGDIGIATNAPSELLHINEGIILATGTHGAGTTLSGIGSGSRFIWYPKKSAFRAGRIEGTQWDDASIGEYSTAMGYNTIASGIYSTALGHHTLASGSYSVALGKESEATGAHSTAIGLAAMAQAEDTTALGYTARASGWRSTAIGAEALASGSKSAAVGSSATASGTYSFAMGLETTASSSYTTAIGYDTTASSTAAVAMGFGTTASNEYAVAIGKWNTASGYAATVMGRGLTVSGDYSFGIGLADMSGDVFSQNNSMAVLSGNVGIGTTTPTERLYVVGDILATGTITDGSSRTFKENIQELSLNQALETIKNLDPVTYYYNADQEKDLHIGLIAEDVPELVATPQRNGVSPMDIIATLTKVVQFQEEELSHQEFLIQQQQKKIKEMNHRIKEILPSKKESKRN